MDRLITFYTIQEWRKTHKNDLNEPIIMTTTERAIDKIKDAIMDLEVAHEREVNEYEQEIKDLKKEIEKKEEEIENLKQDIEELNDRL